MDSLSIFDAQVNYGQCAFGPNCDFELYCQHAEKLGINRAVIVPTATHIFNAGNHTETAVLWRPNVDPTSRYYMSVKPNDGPEEIINNPKHPYQNFNRHVAAFVRAYNERRNALRLFFAAKIHPFLDDPDCLEGVLNDDLACLKMHGIASHSDPTTFPRWVPEFIRHHDLPVLVHTDCYQGEIDPTWSEHSKALHTLYTRNNPMEYIRWGIEQRIRVLINHAARLDVESIHIVNNEPDLMLVYGPDSLLQVEQERLAIPTDNYALTLFEHARIDKVIFSTDYRWNVTDRNQWNNLYWDSVNNIRETLDAAGQRKVLTTNAESFYKLPRH